MTHDYFADFERMVVSDKLDICIGQNGQALLWAKAKKAKSKLHHALIQLILTLGKTRLFDHHLPPRYLGAFNAEQIIFISYESIQAIFYQNDLNWNISSSDQRSNAFRLLSHRLTSDLHPSLFTFTFQKDHHALQQFIKKHFYFSQNKSDKIQINNTNFLMIYHQWLKQVRPTLCIPSEAHQAHDMSNSDYYLADLGLVLFNTMTFIDQAKAYHLFWEKYERPSQKSSLAYMKAQRHLLVPQDVRERKGSFFTPPLWVEKSQQSLAEILGENWQTEYYIWDCAAGTGNLLNGLVNPKYIWASTLDQADINILQARIKHGANLRASHVFQFDFLNDSFSKLPNSLQKIIHDPEKRKKLVIYINPPYSETNAKKGTHFGIKNGKSGLNLTTQKIKYDAFLGKAGRELYAQFLARIYHELNGCYIGIFSTIKLLSAPFYAHFRTHFLAKLESIFLVPANTFDNVSGAFPIAFQIWNTRDKQPFQCIKTPVYNKNGLLIGEKNIYAYHESAYINDWMLEQRALKSAQIIGRIFCIASDFQHQNNCRLNSQNIPNQAGFTIIDICESNLMAACIFYAVRHCMAADWLNDRDQFLYPNDGWKTDHDFQKNCLIYTLFSNHIQSKYGTNHWIPFSENEIHAKATFESDFMVKFIQQFTPQFTHVPCAAQAVWAAGKALWTYYHAQENANINASLYDIRAYFQGRNAAGKMRTKSQNETYNRLIKNLREQLKVLANVIAPKLYDYGFLRA